MKSGEVPQDEAELLGTWREVQYAVNERGEYVQVVSKGWEPKVAALEHALGVFSAQAEAVRQQVLKGELSPLAFHMERAMMDVALLASYAQLPKRVVKRLLKPDGWSKVEPEEREKLARALNVSVEALATVP